MIGEALAIGSTLVSLFGSPKSAAANKASDRYLAKRQSDLDNWYNQEYNSNFLDTAMGRSALQSLKTQYADQMKRVSQNNAITGASDEAKIGMADRASRSYADAINRLAGHGTYYKDAIRREYQGLKMNLDNLQQQNLANKSQNWSNLMNNSLNAGIGFAEASGNGAFDKWDNKLSEWFKNMKKVKANPSKLAG